MDSNRRPPRAEPRMPTNYRDPSMAQYPAVRSTQPSTNASYLVRMQPSTERSQTYQSQDRNPMRHPQTASQRSNERFSHISLLSKQDSHQHLPTQNDFSGGPAVDQNNAHLDENSYSDGQVLKSHGYSGYNESDQPPVARVKKNDTDRIRHMLQRGSGNLTSASHVPTMEALTAAIRSGLTSSEPLQRPEPVRTRTDPSMRIPFQEDPDSPSSAYTDVTTSHARPQSVPLSTYQGYEPRDSRPSTIQEHETEDHDRSGMEMDLPTPNSVNPFFANEHPGMSSKIPASKRPPKLDIIAVREMESRGSVTSLPDLIRRATRLASNLDKGKTASRLGLLDFFGSNEKLGNHEKRDSSYSDVLDAFPTVGSPNRDRPTTMWPDGQKSEADLQKDAEMKKNRGRYCGMSPMWFSVVLISLFLLVAAAVLIPVFLILLPREHAKTNSANCSTSHPCSNGGFSVFVNDVCSCICVDGFTNSDCSQEKDPGCTTYNLQSDTKTLDNATIGSSVLSVFGSSQKTFNVNLNQTNLLTIFANTNLSCTSENSLVEFGSSTAVKSKRYVMVPGMMSTDQHIPALNLPAAESKDHSDFMIVDEIEDESEGLKLLPTRALSQRDNTISTNGIVFATTTSMATSQSASSTAVQSGNVATATASPSNTTISGVSAQQIDFAGTVVLYVLQTFQQINVAVAANQAIASYFEATGNKNSTVEVVSGSERIDANFDKLQIMLANGTVLGGS